MTNDWRGLELYSPANLEHSKKIADMLWQSGAYCKPWIKNPSTILVIMQRGASLGFDPLTALDELFQFAQGGAWGIRIGAARAMCARAGKWHYEVSTDDLCVLTVNREGWEPHEETITREEAQQAGIGKQTLGKYPRQILRAAAFRRAAQTVFADCLLGFVPIDTDTEGRDTPDDIYTDRSGGVEVETVLQQPAGTCADAPCEAAVVDLRSDAGGGTPAGNSELQHSNDSAPCGQSEPAGDSPRRGRGRPAGIKNKPKEEPATKEEKPAETAEMLREAQEQGALAGPVLTPPVKTVFGVPVPPVNPDTGNRGIALSNPVEPVVLPIRAVTEPPKPATGAGVRYTHGDRQHRMVLVEAVQKCGMSPQDMNYIRSAWAAFSQANEINCDVNSIIEGFKACLSKRVSN